MTRTTQKGLVSWLFVEVTLAVAHRRGTPVYYRRDPDTYLRCEFCYRTPRRRQRRPTAKQVREKLIREFGLETGMRMSRFGG